MADIDLIAEHLSDGHVVPEMISAASVLTTVGLVVVISWRQDVLLIEQSGDFAETIALPAVGEHFSYYFSRSFIDNKLVLILRAGPVSKRDIAAEIITQLGMSLLHRLDLFAGVFALELV